MAWASRANNHGDEFCEIDGCQKSPSFSLDGNRPAQRCSIHREEDMYSVRDDHRYDNGAHEHQQGQQQQQQGGGHAAQHNQGDNDDQVDYGEDVFPDRCEYEGCSRTAKYGDRGGPFFFCQKHKRKDMYTIRHGKDMIAVHDGKAFRTAASRHNSAPATSNGGGPAAGGENAQNGSGGGGGSPNEGQNVKLSRSVLREPGALAIDKSPCVFPGCNTRPQFGVAGGGAKYCRRHKTGGMVNIWRTESIKTKNFATAESEPSAASKDNNKNPTTTAGHAKDKDGKKKTKVPPSMRKISVTPAVALKMKSVKKSKNQSKRENRGKDEHKEQKEHKEQNEGVVEGLGNEAKKDESKGALDGDGMVGVKNANCFHPKCSIRPEFGVAGERATHCRHHKRDTMVNIRRRVSTEKKAAVAAAIARNIAKVLGKNNAVRDQKHKENNKNAVVPPVVSPKKKLGAAKKQTEHEENLGKKQRKKEAGRDGELAGYEQGENKTNKDKKRERETEVQQNGNRMEQGAVDKNEPEQETSPTGPPSSSPPSSAQTEAASQSPTTAVSESSKRRKTSTSTSTVSPKASQSTSPRNAHVPDASGGAPSAEIRILERAREAARVAVETSGSGKRPRVPSIKALRAAGKAGDEVVGAQLMTKELKEKALMRAKEMRAFRAAASAAGLASGQVLEALTVVDGTGGGGAAAPGDVVGRTTWRQLTSAEITLQAEHQRAFLAAGQQQQGQGAVSTTGRYESGGDSGKDNLAVATTTTAAEAVPGDANTSGRKRKEIHADGTAMIGQLHESGTGGGKCCKEAAIAISPGDRVERLERQRKVAPSNGNQIDESLSLDESGNNITASFPGSASKENGSGADGVLDGLSGSGVGKRNKSMGSVAAAATVGTGGVEEFGKKRKAIGSDRARARKLAAVAKLTNLGTSPSTRGVKSQLKGGGTPGNQTGKEAKKDMKSVACGEDVKPRGTFAQTLCQSKDCERKARFDDDGIARFCKKHGST